MLLPVGFPSHTRRLALTTHTLQAKGPVWLLSVAGLGVLWNAYGAYQFAGSFTQSKDSLMTVGMTATQAALYLSLPTWISVVFAIGVFGGLAGSVALLLRRAIAVPIFIGSFVGYVLLFAGDYFYGIFANIPEQLVILAVVVLIAAGLLATSVFARKQGFSPCSQP